MELSERLAAIAEYVFQGETVADIGTDHGLLPIFLLQRNISPKVVLTDIKRGPLEKAKANLLAHAPDIEADLRLGGGLEPMEKGEVDTVIIAGMGGVMMTEILAADQVKTRSYRRFILQPRNGRDKLRIWLYHNGYTISEERLVREGKYICEILVVDTSRYEERSKNDESYEKRLSNLEFEISPLLFSSKEPLLKELLECRIKVEENIIADICEKGSESSLRELKKKKERLKRLRELEKQLITQTLQIGGK